MSKQKVANVKGKQHTKQNGHGVPSKQPGETSHLTEKRGHAVSMVEKPGSQKKSASAPSTPGSNGGKRLPGEQAGATPGLLHDSANRRKLDLLAKRTYLSLRALIRALEKKIKTLDNASPTEIRSLFFSLKEARVSLRDFYVELAPSQCPRCSGSLGKPASPLSLAFPDLAQLLIKIDREHPERSRIPARVPSDDEGSAETVSLVTQREHPSDPREAL